MTVKSLSFASDLQTLTVEEREALASARFEIFQDGGGCIFIGAPEPVMDLVARLIEAAIDAERGRL